jgi:hypothetical protein
VSDPTNTLNPAIEKAIERALETAEPAPCKSCGKEGAPPYPFAYGRTLKSESSHGSTVNTYSVEPGVAHICEDCASEYRRARASKTRNQGIIAAAITVILLVLGIAVQKGDLRDLFLVGAILPAIATIWAFSTVRTLHRDRDRAGRWQAVALCEPELKDQGYDQFWSGT